MDSTHIVTLIAKSGKGDTECYKSLYEHLVSRVFPYVRSRVKTKEAATDLVQDVFIELWKALPKFVFRSLPQFYAFVFVITKRQLAQYYSRGARDPLPFDENALGEEDGDSNHEQEDEISRLLETLSPEAKEVITLHHWSGYTFGEIALMLRMNETAVRVRHHRAIATLRKNIKP